MYIVIIVIIILTVLLLILYKKRKNKFRGYVFDLLRNESLNLNDDDLHFLQILMSATLLFENKKISDTLKDYGKPTVYFEILCLNLYLIDRYIFDMLNKNQRDKLLRQYSSSMAKVFPEIDKNEFLGLLDNRVLFFNKMGTIDKIMEVFDRIIYYAFITNNVEKINLDSRFVGIVILDPVLKLEINESLEIYYGGLFEKMVIKEVDKWILELN